MPSCKVWGLALMRVGPMPLTAVSVATLHTRTVWSLTPYAACRTVRMKLQSSASPSSTIASLICLHSQRLPSEGLKIDLPWRGFGDEGVELFEA